MQPSDAVGSSGRLRSSCRFPFFMLFLTPLQRPEPPLATGRGPLLPQITNGVWLCDRPLTLVESSYWLAPRPPTQLSFHAPF